MDTDILNKAKYYCARAERSPRNLRLFLMRREVSSDEIDEYLALLQEGRYYDPQRYAESYARTRYRDMSQGPHKIRQALRMQEVPTEILEAVLPEILEEEEPNYSLAELLESKLRRTSARTPRALFDKMMRYGVGRGYHQSEVYEALQEVLQRMREEEEDNELEEE